MTTSTYNTRNVLVTATQKSQATIAPRVIAKECRPPLIATWSPRPGSRHVFRHRARRHLKAEPYLLKSALRKEMMDAIRTVFAGRPSIPPEVAVQIAEHAAADALSEREVEVLRCVARGAANKAVAIRLHISEETVKVQ